MYLHGFYKVLCIYRVYVKNSLLTTPFKSTFLLHPPVSICDLAQLECYLNPNYIVHIMCTSTRIRTLVLLFSNDSLWNEVKMLLLPSSSNISLVWLSVALALILLAYFLPCLALFYVLGCNVMRNWDLVSSIIPLYCIPLLATVYYYTFLIHPQNLSQCHTFCICPQTKQLPFNFTTFLETLTNNQPYWSFTLAKQGKFVTRKIFHQPGEYRSYALLTHPHSHIQSILNQSRRKNYDFFGQIYFESGEGKS